MSSYDNWLNRGADYGQAAWEEWSESSYAQDAYTDFMEGRVDVAGHIFDILTFEQWLDTEDADRAFDSARYDESDIEPDLERDE